MNINYNVDHRLLQLDLFNNLKGSDKIATWLLLSQVWHFYRCQLILEFKQGQMATDIPIGKNTWVKARKLLIKEGIVKIVANWDRKTNRGYLLSIEEAYVPVLKKLCPWNTDPKSPGDTVKNSKEFKPERDLDLLSGDKSFPKMSGTSTDQDYWNTINKGKIKNKK
jgi:hypothetical protein